MSLRSMVALLMPRRAAVILVLLMSVSLVLAFRWYLEKSSQLNSSDVSILQAVPQFASEAPNMTVSQKDGALLPAACLEGVVTVQPGGRLGNQVLEYASAAAVAQSNRLRLAIPSAILKSLSAIFNLTAEPLSLLLQRPPCRGLSLTENGVLEDKQKRPRDQLTIEETVQWARCRHLPVILRKWIVLTDYIASSLDSFRQEFRFREEIQSSANTKLDKIINETAEATGFTKKQVCTVGVHVRRTDYGPYMKARYHLQQEAGLDYYKAATAEMLAALRSECRAVAFVVTSDDSQWCQEQLLPVLTRIATDEASASVGFLMSSQSPADDLCLLSSCQHLVMAYGTFGLTAALLSGGRTIMYDTASHGACPQPPAQTMASAIPHWQLVS